MTDLREAAQMAKRVIAERMCSDCDGHVCCWADGAFVLNAIDKALAQPEQIQKPAGIAYSEGFVSGYKKGLSERVWQGLTDEDLSVCDEDGVILARYWEAKLREKNT